MKFYKYKHDFDYWNKIINKKLTCVYSNHNYVRFYKNGKKHNIKNYALIDSSYKYKQFFLNGIGYFNEKRFTKKSWRKFAKLQVFL
jgi:hypothetical protein